MGGAVSEARWLDLSGFIAAQMGLHFPRERWSDLKRAFEGAAREFGFTDIAACIAWLLASPPANSRLQVLANHLTIGETYFFRDGRTLLALAGNILPELIQARRGSNQRLRIWSAACCSGEEPYTLAILLHRLLPDLKDWQVTITATDINPHFLNRAAAGVYGEWSFRGAPAWLKDRYFKKTPDGRYAIVPEIREMVRFRALNLIGDAYPSPATGTDAMDIVFCRNVLMYFTPSHVSRVIGRLHGALAAGGWLAVSPSEASRALFRQFEAVNFPGAILFRKNGAPIRVAAADSNFAGTAVPAVEAASGPSPVAQSPGHGSLHPERADTPPAGMVASADQPQTYARLARVLADQGRLQDALTWCDRWVAADKLNAAAHYLRAIILQELDDAGQARAALQRALYLDQEFVLAHFSLGNLARGRGRMEEAAKHYANARHLLRRYQPDDPLPESDGLTAGRLAEILISLSESTKVL
jgi:chemotaxis protein methyltransferase CheR